MLALIPLLLLNQQPKMTRAEFVQALRRVPGHATKYRVLALLGKPDLIIKWQDGSGWESWRYGTSIDNPMPTRGEIVFASRGERWVFGGSGEPPPTTLISEEELARTLRLLPWRHDYIEDIDLLRLANRLIPMGRDKALAVLREYARMNISTQWLFALTQVIFLPKSNAAEVRSLGWNYVRVFSDIPITAAEIVLFDEKRDNFLQYVDRHSTDWTIRSAPLVPPDDPFPAVLEAAKLDHDLWNRIPDLRPYSFAWSKAREFRNPDYWREDSHEDDSFFGFQKSHEAFLRLGCHWDKAKQCYVRGDGSTLK